MSAHEHPRAYPTVLDMVQHALAKIEQLERLTRAQGKEIQTLKNVLRGDGK